MNLVELPPDMPLSRYMTLDKFRSLIKEAAIYCRRIDLFQDQFEGRLNAEDQEKRREEMWAFFQKMGMEKDQFDTAEEFMNSHGLWSDQSQGFVSCWYGSDEESDRMWAEYCPEGGVLLKTTVAALRSALPQEPPTIIQPITYVDRETESLKDSDLDVWFVKDNEFVHENEIRLVAHVPPPIKRIDDKHGQLHIPQHYFVPVDLGILIQGIVLSPGLPEDARAGIASVLENAHIATLITESRFEAA